MISVMMKASEPEAVSESEPQGCHNLLTINPKEQTSNPEIIMENIVPYGSRRLKNPNIPNLHMLMRQN